MKKSITQPHNGLEKLQMATLGKIRRPLLRIRTP